MMTRTRSALIGLVLIIACASLARYASADGALRLSMDVAESDDSVYARLRWTPVRDARNQDVQHYVPSLRNHGQVVATTTTTDTVFIFALPKTPGDSMSLVGEVYAVDVRGTAGAAASTEPLSVVIPDPGPPAPVITIDTVRAAAVDDLSVVDCGDTWCDVAWTNPNSVQTPFAVMVLTTEPASLLRDPELDHLPAYDGIRQQLGFIPDTTMWEVLDDGIVAGMMGMIIVHDGTCASPVVVEARSDVTCRVERLLPSRPYRMMVASLSP